MVAGMDRLADQFRAQSGSCAQGTAPSKLRVPAFVRPTLMTHRIEFDPDLITEIVRQVETNANASKRLGLEFRSRHEPPENEESEKKRETPPPTDEAPWPSKDDLQPLDDVCTRFCNDKFFPNAHARVTLVLNVLGLFSRLSVGADGKTPRDRKVIFKGGVMQRLVLLEVLADLPPESARPVLAHLMASKALGISDMDFELTSHTASKAFQHRTALLSFLLLACLQIAMMHELEGRTPRKILSADWNVNDGQTELAKAIQEKIDSLPSSNAMHGATVDFVHFYPLPVPKTRHRTRSGAARAEARTSKVCYACGATRCSIDAAKLFEELGFDLPFLRNVDSDALFVSLNTYLGEDTPKRADHHQSVFHLARIKHAYALYYTTKRGDKRIERLSGEMIDMSQGLPDCEKRVKFYGMLAQPYRSYGVLGVEGDRLWSYTMDGFFLDVLTTLHHSEHVPWEAEKLEKRLSRYASFLVGCMLQHLAPVAVAEELHRLLEALRRGGGGSFRLPLTKLFFSYERRIADRKYRSDLFRTLDTWRLALATGGATSRPLMLNEDHFVNFTHFVQPTLSNRKTSPKP